MKKLMMMSECPRCHSLHTGKIVVRQGFSLNWEQKSILKSWNNAELIKFVYPAEYRNYYNRYGINAYCEDCGYEFKGVYQSVKLDKEDFEKYKNDMTSDYIKNFTTPIKKKRKKIFKGLFKKKGN